MRNIGQSGLSRLLDLAGGGDASDLRVNLRWLRIFLMMHLAARNLFRLSSDAMIAGDGLAELVCQLLVVCCLVALIPRVSRRAIQVAAGLTAIHVLQTLPVTANHTFLELFLLMAFAFLDESEEGEDELLVRTLRWLLVMVLFWSGLQKVFYGRYFDGQYLAYATATTDRFAFFLQYLMPPEEFLRLRELEPAQVGMGPYRVDSILFVVMSNAVYVVEMLTPVLMIIRRTRVWATLGCIVFIVMIELGARELMFGALMINLLLLFLPGRLIKLLFPALAVMYVYLVATNYGLVPMFRFHY